MGTDLVQIGNHKINFKQRHFSELANEIAGRLNSIQFVNAEYLRLFALHWESSFPRRVRAIREIKTKMKWTYQEEDPEYYHFEEDGFVELKGPFGLRLTFNEYHICFSNPPVRYHHWVEGDKPGDLAFRNEWRKYMYQVVHAFRGDRVIYLADNSHPLDEFRDMEASFAEVEAALQQRFGKSAATFSELAAKPHDRYMIDFLQNIDWDHHIPLDEFYPEPDDRSDIAYMLEEFAHTKQLEEYDWDEETLQHKRIGGAIHFWHMARIDGVLVMQRGILSGESSIKTVLDEYAPFTYDELEQQMKEEGYDNNLEHFCSVNYYKTEHRKAWRDAIVEFAKKLPWTGNGVMGAQSFSNEESSLHFYVVEPQRAIELLLRLGSKYAVKAPIEVVQLGEDDTVMILFKQ